MVTLANNMDTAPYQYLATSEWRAAVSLPYTYDRNSVDMGGYTFYLHACTRGQALGATPAGGDCLDALAIRTHGAAGLVPKMTLFVECDDRSTYIIDGLTGSVDATQEQEVGGQHGFYVYEFLAAFGNSCPVIGYQIVTAASTWHTSGSETATGLQADRNGELSDLPPNLGSCNPAAPGTCYNTGTTALYDSSVDSNLFFRLAGDSPDTRVPPASGHWIPDPPITACNQLPCLTSVRGTSVSGAGTNDKPSDTSTVDTVHDPQGTDVDSLANGAASPLTSYPPGPTPVLPGSGAYPLHVAAGGPGQHTQNHITQGILRTLQTNCAPGPAGCPGLMVADVNDDTVEHVYTFKLLLTAYGRHRQYRQLTGPLNLIVRCFDFLYTFTAHSSFQSS